MELDDRVLDHEEVPEREWIVHRRGHLSDVRATVELMADGMSSSPFVLFGQPGTGKTAITKRVLDERADQTDIATAYVDCWEDYKTNALLSEVVSDLGLSVVHKNSTSTKKLTQSMQKRPTKSRVVVLDEAEMVLETEALEVLDNAPRLSVICIVNDREKLAETIDGVWPAPTDRQCLSFGSYSVVELTEILSKRAEYGIAGPVPEDVLETIADAAGGDARLGICTLRESVVIANETDEAVIRKTWIGEAAERAERLLHQRLLTRLSEHQKTCYDILLQQGELSPKEIYDAYCERVDDAMSRRTVENYLWKMTQYDLLVSEGRTQDSRYRVNEAGYANLDAVC